MPRPLYPWPGFMPTTPVLPKLYWEAITPEQELQELCKRLHMLYDYATQLGTITGEQGEQIRMLIDQFQKFMESGFEDYYEKQLLAWINEHFAELISAGMKQVYFGLTSDGYFCAYVPDSWSEITFDTGAVYGRSDYGRLILRFEPDPAMGVIDNTYGSNSSFSNAELSSANRRLADVIQTLINDLETNIRRTDVTYNAEFTNLDEVVSNGNF